MFQIFGTSRGEGDFLTVSRELGYGSPTKAERRYGVPVLSGRDVVIEVPNVEDTGHALVVPLLHEREGAGLHTVIIASSVESVKWFGRRIKELASAGSRKLTAVELGVDENIRKELQLLAHPFEVVIGTSERIIDHIRRDNLALGRVRRVYIELGLDFEETAFDKDVLFICSKLPSKVQTVVIDPEVAEPHPLAALLRRPVVLRTSPDPQVRYDLYEAESEESKPRLLADLMWSAGLPRSLVLCRTPAAARALGAYLDHEGISSAYLGAGTGAEERQTLSRDLASGALRAVVAELAEGGEAPDACEALFFYGVPTTKAADAWAKGACERGRFVILSSPEETGPIHRFQEVHHVERSSNPSPDEVLKGRITSILKRIKENEDPDELNRFRKIIGRHVPLFLRGYFAAFILKELFGGQPAAGRAPQGEMKTLFVSVGKNRKAFPKDLSKLFSAALKIDAAAIGNIKVLDNYSFVDLPESLADKAIGLLDGTDYRGRKITVNRARKRDEQSGST